MKYRAIELDFARRRPRLTGRGLLLLLVGAVTAVFVVVDYRAAAAESAGLEWRLAALEGAGRPAKVDKATQRAEQDAAAAINDLTTPWSSLLRELELASADSNGTVAVLGIEPDRDKHEVHVLAEARSLPIALAYVERLQKSRALSYPMLQSHEVQLKDPQHPVRFEIKAGWSGQP